METKLHIAIKFCGVIAAAAFLFFLCGTTAVSAQNVNAHKKKIGEIEKEIEYLNNQIATTQKKHKNTLEELVFIQKKVSNRKKILAELDSQLKEQNLSIDIQNANIRRMEERLDTLEHYYRHLILNTYKHRDSRIWFMYILSSSNIEQGYRRWKYLRNYSNSINSQGQKIMKARQELISKKTELIKLRNETLNAQKSRETEYRTLLDEEKKAKNYAKTLTANQNRYKKQMEQKRKEAQRLNKEIERMLAEAVKAKPLKGETQEQASSRIKLSTDFQSNKGRLPWPVEKGVVIEQFGQHNHPLFKGVKMPFNNGINISTSANSKVFSIFNGIVKQIIAIPGYNQCVLVQHGSYFTFYCKLSGVSVKVGENIKTGQEIGTLSSSQNTSTLHFELWNGTTKQNPELWLRPR